MIEEHANYIDGEWRVPRDEHFFELFAAGDRGAPLGRFPRSSAHDVEAAVASCASAEVEWQSVSLDTRRTVVARAFDSLRDEPDARGEVAASLGLLASEIALHRSLLARAGERDLLRSRFAAPAGVYAVHVHWSELWTGIAHEVFGALLEGRAVLLVSDPHLPFLAESVARALDAARLPRGVLALVHDDRDRALELVLGDARIDTLRASGPGGRMREIERRAHRHRARTRSESELASDARERESSATEIATSDGKLESSVSEREPHASEREPDAREHERNASRLEARARELASAVNDLESPHDASSPHARNDRSTEPALDSARSRRARFGAGIDVRRGPELDLCVLRNASILVGQASDPAACAREVVERAFGRAQSLFGQRPGSIGRVLCHERQFSRFTAELLAEIERDHDATRPLAAREIATLDHLRRAQELGLDEGATLLCSRESSVQSAAAQRRSHARDPAPDVAPVSRAPGSAPSREPRPEAMLWPAVFTNVEEHMRIAWLGRPAPFLCLMRVASDESGAALARTLDGDPVAEDLSARANEPAGEPS